MCAYQRVTNVSFLENVAHVLNEWSFIGQVLNESNHQDQLIQLEVWRSNIGGMLDEAVENKSLTDMMIALSPMGKFSWNIFFYIFVSLFLRLLVISKGESPWNKLLSWRKKKPKWENIWHLLGGQNLFTANRKDN